MESDEALYGHRRLVRYGGWGKVNCSMCLIVDFFKIASGVASFKFSSFISVHKSVGCDERSLALLQ